MPLYNCDYCDYKTDRKNDIAKHNQTRKHKEKVKQSKRFLHGSLKVLELDEKIYKCQHCDEIFSSKSSLSNHRKICEERKEMENKIITLEKENKKIAQEKEQMTKQLELFQQLIQSNTTLKKDSSSVTYISNTFMDAPPLLALDDYSEVNDSEEMTLAEVILFQYKNNNLGKFLSEFIVKMYKKDDPKEQSLWNSDTTRLTYIVKELLKNKKSDWAIDKKGLKTKEYIIVPLLKYLKPKIRSYMLKLSKNMNDVHPSKILQINQNVQSAGTLLVEISKGIIANDIVKRIAPHFYLSKTVKHNLLTFEKS